MIHKFGYKDLVHNDNQKDICPVCKAEQAIQRVRELHKEINGYCAYCADIGSCCNPKEFEFPCQTIKDLDGEQ